jgi:hypothetical protein
MECQELESLTNKLVPLAEYHSAHSAIDIALHRNDEHTLLFFANPTEYAIETSIHFNGEHQFQRVWGTAQSYRARESLPIVMAPYSVQIWEVSHD